MEREEIVKLSWFKRQIRDAFVRGLVVADVYGRDRNEKERFEAYFNETYKKEEEK